MQVAGVEGVVTFLSGVGFTALSIRQYRKTGKDRYLIGIGALMAIVGLLLMIG